MRDNKFLSVAFTLRLSILNRFISIKNRCFTNATNFMETKGKNNLSSDLHQIDLSTISVEIYYSFETI